MATVPIRDITLTITCPPLYAQDGKGDSAVAHMRFVCPTLGWVWYAMEQEVAEDPRDSRMFGLVFGACTEFGYFEPCELARNGVHVDLDFVPAPLSEIRARHADTVRARDPAP